MARRRQDPAAMPVGRPPAGPVFVRADRVPDEPAALHLGHAKRGGAAARHLVLAQRQVHVLGRVAVDVIGAKRAAALRKRARGVSVRAAAGEAAAIAAGRFGTARGADPGPPLTDAVNVACMRPVGIVPGAHRLLAAELELVIRRQKLPGRGAFPFMRIAQSPALGLAQRMRLVGAHPDHRVDHRDVGIFEHVDADLGILRALRLGVVNRRAEGPAADAFPLPVAIALLHRGNRAADPRRGFLGRHRVAGDRRIALPDVRRPGEDLADAPNLGVGHAAHLLHLAHHRLVARLQALRIPRSRRP